MSTRTYPLRSRMTTGIVSQGDEARYTPVPSRIPIHKSRKSIDTPGVVNPNAGTPSSPARSYRDVVISRPPSAMEETTRHSPEGLGPRSVAKPITVDDISNSIITGINNSSDYSEDNGLPWTTVRRRRAHSLDSAKNSRNMKYIRFKPSKELSKEQKTTVKAATEALTEQQKEQITRRQTLVDDKPEKVEAGPSNPKGKGIDPREWGNINLSEEELNVEAQAAALNSFKTRKESPEYIKEKPSRKKKKSTSKKNITKQKLRDDLTMEKELMSSHYTRAPKFGFPRINYDRMGRRAESRPAAQIAPKSSLGVALNNVEKRHRKKPSESPSSSSSSPSSKESESSDEESERSSSPSSQSSSGRSRRRHRQHGKHGKRRSRKSPKRSKTTIKPIPPKDYDGSPDPRSYHRFVRESEAYLRDGKVHRSRQIRLVAYHLEGKAYDFYMQKVADDEDSWTLHDFYVELFNYCFPIDYRMQMRKKLNRCYQGDNKTITEYVYELQELFNMIGAIPDQEKVIKFWYGVKPIIQKGLWRDNLNPDISTWNEVVTKAEVIEIAENITDRRDRGSGNPPQQGTSSNSRGSNFNRNKIPHQSKSSRSLMFEPASTKNNSAGNSSRNKNNEFRKGTSQIPTPRYQSKAPNGIPSNRPNGNYKTFPSKPQLSEKEMAELRAEGKCFKCKKPGHVSRNCPDASTVKQNGNGSRPPGLSAHSMGMELVEDDVEPVENLDEIPLGIMSIVTNPMCSCHLDVDHSLVTCQQSEVDPEIDQSSNWRDHYPYREREGIVARRTIGDCYGIMVDEILTLHQPYPDDAIWSDSKIRPDQRFAIKRRKGDIPGYTIFDRLTKFEVSLPQAYVENDRFDLAHWYAKLRAQATEYHGPIAHHWQIGDSIHFVTKKLLEDGIMSHFPNTNPETADDSRFGVYLKDKGSNFYIIHDLDLEIFHEISWDLLNDPNFDLIGWYLTQLKESGLFYNRYLKLHKGKYSVEDTDRNDDLPGLVILEDDRPSALDNDLYDSDTEDNSSDDELFRKVNNVLLTCQPYPGDDEPMVSSHYPAEARFILERARNDLLCIYDSRHGFEAYLSFDLARWSDFSIAKWFTERCAFNCGSTSPWEDADLWMNSRTWESTVLEDNIEDLTSDLFLAPVQVDREKYPAMQRNAAKVKDDERLLPKPVVLKVEIEGQPVRALVDTGSLGDFISSTLVDQLKLNRKTLKNPVGLQLAVQGSRSKINSVTNAHLVYRGISEHRHFDVINLNEYDVILGTPWLFQHKVSVGLNPARIAIGSNDCVPIAVGNDTRFLLNTVTLEDPAITAAREELMECATPLCRKVEETELPPFRDINHTIPLIDENKTYSWRASRCPEIFRGQWAEKRDAYLKSGRWKLTTARNTVPMLLIPKPHKPKDAQELRTVIDLRERNKNTVKLSSPLPDIEGVLRRVASKPLRSVLDLTAAYEQIRIVPEHVERSAVTTPDGNMVSLVLQMGDCNAPATYQSLMNHIFSPYLGRFLDVYLDDIIIYSDTLKDHIEHCKIALKILEQERLYLSKGKIRFLASELKLLGHVVDDGGIRMDPDKVDSVATWKVPTNRDLLRGFIGSVGYLADDIPNVRIPLGVLSAVTGDKVPFRWGYTEQRAFEEVKQLVETARNHSRVPIKYGPTSSQVWLVTDGCATGIAGLISQGDEWKLAKIAAFYSAKLNAAQRNYPVHEIEMLAGIETMLRYRDILQGVHFKWITDHKGLIYLMNQKSLSGRQARWVEKISSFVFEVVYVAGSENVVADALSRLYSNDTSATARSRTEFTYHDVTDDDTPFFSAEGQSLAGVGAQAPNARKLVPGAETGRPETSREFATRMKDRFVLLGPGERKVGGSGTTHAANTQNPTTLPNTDAEPVVSNNEQQFPEMEVAPVLEITELPSITDTSLVDIVSESSIGIDLLQELQGNYDKDPIFKAILSKPKEFRNFEIDNGLVYLREAERKLLCIPNILIRTKCAGNSHFRGTFYACTFRGE